MPLERLQQDEFEYATHKETKLKNTIVRQNRQEFASSERENCLELLMIVCSGCLFVFWFKETAIK